MFLQLIFSSPALAFVWFAAILIALTVHEFAHAYVANILGDKTAERQGRLTLNPIPHIDPWGLLLLLVMGFGWAKPVPFNPQNMKDPKWDAVKVALAGPASNLIMAAIAAGVMRWLLFQNTFASLNLLMVFLFLMVFMNLLLLFFNLIPVHPLDGSKLVLAIFDQPKHANIRRFLLQQGPQILFVLVLISIIGIFPFDPFFFIRLPSELTCNAMIGENCMQFFGQIIYSLS